MGIDGVVEFETDSKLSLASGFFHEPEEPVAMVMASFQAKIRHVFADTFSPEHFLQ